MATISSPSILSGVLDEPHAPRWTKDQYYRMAEAGLFEGRRVELIAGEIIEMGPIGSSHATAVTLLQAALQPLFAESAFIRTQSPLNLSGKSEPEPDIAIIEGQIRDYATAHPVSALLVVEVSDSTLVFDRSIKSGMYAEAGIQEYWILNLVERQLEVHRLCAGERYTRISIHNSGEMVSPLAAPGATVKVADLLP